MTRKLLYSLAGGLLTFRSFFSLVLTAMLVTQAPGWSQKPAASFVEEGAGLKIVVIEGEGAKNSIRSKFATAPVVEVQDAEAKPVPGAEVIFQLPAAGPGGVFNGWMRTQTARTGSDGRAAATGMTPNDQEGRFNIKVSASEGAKRGSAVIAQANVKNGERHTGEKLTQGPVDRARRAGCGGDRHRHCRCKQWRFGFRSGHQSCFDHAGSGYYRESAVIINKVKLMISRLLPVIVCLLPLLGFCEDRTSVNGPVAGLVFDPQLHALRPLIGVPGAAYLGLPLVSGLDAASVAPSGFSALVVREGRILLFRGVNADPPTLELENAITDADVFAWSADGAVAAIYSSRDRSAQIWKNLATVPEVVSRMALADVPGKVVALAIGASNEHLVAALESEDQGGVYLLQAGAASSLLLRAGSPVSVITSGSDLFVADKTRDQIWQVTRYQDRAAPMIFADAGSGLASPVGMQLSEDRKRLFVANAGSKSLVAFDLETRSVIHSMALDAEPAMLGSLGAKSVWLLNTGTEGLQPWFIADGGPSPSVYFVPAGREQ